MNTYLVSAWQPKEKKGSLGGNWDGPLLTPVGVATIEKRKHAGAGRGVLYVNSTFKKKIQKLILVSKICQN